MSQDNFKDAKLEEQIKKYERFVRETAKIFVRRYRPLVYRFEELLHYGNIGLWNAIKNHKADRGDFSPFARRWILMTILKNTLKENRTIDIPDWVEKDINRIRRAIKKASPELEGEDLYEDIAKTADLTEFEVGELVEISLYSLRMVSIEKPISEEGGITIAHDIEGDEPSEKIQDIRAIVDSWEDEVAKEIIKMRLGIDYGHKFSRAAVARKMNMTTERVRRIEENRLRELENLLGIDY